MSSFGIYLLGLLVVVAGLAWGASLIGVPTTWILIGITIIIGIGILTGVTRTRRPDPPG